jgi:hypothetical protein
MILILPVLVVTVICAIASPPGQAVVNCDRDVTDGEMTVTTDRFVDMGACNVGGPADKDLWQCD